MAPADPAEIRAALGAVGADALVYLVPATATQTGAAVLVPVAGPVETIVLPALQTGRDSPVRRHLAALNDAPTARDAGPVGETDDWTAAEPGRWPGGPLDDLCRWAWSAAMGTLVARVRRWALHRPARLVLVPMDLLTLVPWHAAYTGPDDDRRYAVHELVCSYGVSARMFCATARHPLRPSRSALVVGDPTGDLPYAGVEARAVHERFHPDGTYLGRHPAGDDRNGTTGRAGTGRAGTPEEVLAWIATAGAGPSTLHFACHGRVDPAAPADAHLVLAGGTLTARRLLEASRLAALTVDRVFLAACTTSVTGNDHDEAFSLSSAFVAAGAHTVVGALWRVPDTDTSLLMYLVHHFLDTAGVAPVDALHRAQLWMLDPDRRPPAGMPPELARHCARPTAADPASWAAFTHLGR